jgi:hypothetical protein
MKEGNQLYETFTINVCRNAGLSFSLRFKKQESVVGCEKILNLWKIYVRERSSDVCDISSIACEEKCEAEVARCSNQGVRGPISRRNIRENK